MEFIYNFDDVDTLVIIQKDYKETTEDKQLYVKKLFFENVFNEDTDEFLLMISRAIGGYVEDKIWSIIFGGRDGGKSGIIKILSMCFESYIITINANSLLIDNNSGDEAKKLSWAYNLINIELHFQVK